MHCQEELYIILSDLCNISCGHCVSMSGPKSSRFKMTPEERKALIQWISARHSIRQVHFSGGEPSIQIPLIQAFQAGIDRNVKYAMTTNGWFGNKPAQVLDAIRLDEIFVSYDRFHAQFIESRIVRALLEECIRRGLQTTLKFTINEPEDLMLTRDVLVDGVRLWINQVIKSGRYFTMQEPESSMIQDDAWDGVCPSIDDRINSLERIVYCTGQGLSPCCGPLGFDRMKHPGSVYSLLAEEYLEKNELRKLVASSPFAKQAERSGIDFSCSGARSRCDACRFVHGDFIQAGLPSRYDLTNQCAYPAYFPLKSKLSMVEAESLGKSWDLSYFCTGPIPEHLKDPAPSLLSLGIRAARVTTSNIAEAMSLYERVYLTPFASYLSENRCKEISDKLQVFLLNATNVRLYSFLGKSIGIFAAVAPYSHPKLSDHFVHVGFVGYDRNAAPKEVSVALKKDWMWQVNIMGSLTHTHTHTHTQFSARIQWFNVASQRFFETNGLLPRVLEVSKNV
jgi:MoaA/NifB/PqqE/SkfB family radical SAM enzyme